MNQQASVACEVCGRLLQVGDHAQFTCIGFDQRGEPIVSAVHTQCLDTKERQN